ncbi:MAG: SsrA-binding protein SmpB [Candidatus Cloacimonetes bacterium]|nr:SsrA-binding protein SmpB [Candidatus Cloacimonadota bacterium]
MGVKIIATNRKARYQYRILEKYEAGISLTGAEIKSVRLGRVSLSDSYVRIKDNEASLINTFIAPYQKATDRTYDPRRTRKLLLKNKELKRLKNKLANKNLTIVPLRVMIKNNLAKVETALAKGKKKYERKETKKLKTIEREIETTLKEVAMTDVGGVA